LHDLVVGKITVKDLDDEELVRLRFRDRHGGFSGRPPALIPTAVAEAMRKELLKRGQHRLEGSLIAALDRMHSILDDEDAEPRDKIAAAKFIIERVLGKAPEKIEVSGDLRYEKVAARVVRGRRKAEEDGSQ
jgi:hypothetical protein